MDEGAGRGCGAARVQEVLDRRAPAGADEEAMARTALWRGKEREAWMVARQHQRQKRPCPVEAALEVGGRKGVRRAVREQA